MGFEVIEKPVRTIWVPIDNANRSTYETLYQGQLVYSSSDGVVNLGQASGVADTSGKKVPFGAVVGFNAKNPQYNSTYKGEYLMAVDPHSTTTEFVGVEGPWSKGDKSAMAQISVIGPETILKGRLFNASYGTAPSVVTVSTASTTGAGYTASACDFTPVADLCSTYCRTGANRGIYRITTDTSTTVRTTGHYFPNDIAVGDTFVSVPLRTIGTSYVQTDAEATFFDVSASPATNYWVIEVLELNLKTAGDEYVIFRFGADHFCLARA